MEGFGFWFQFIMGACAAIAFGLFFIWFIHSYYAGRFTDRILSFVDWINRQRQ